MTRRYYKTNHPNVLAVLETMRIARTAMHAQADAFAARFGGKALYRNGLHSVSFYGLKFHPAKDATIWTKPDREGQCQRPRTKEKLKEDAEALRELQTQWNTDYPSISTSREDLFEAIGTDWGSTAMCGIGYLEHGDYLYIETACTLAPHCIEILGSEYEAAKKASKEVKS